MARKSKGRQKITIAKIEKVNHRQVTFSKRRSGLFKKACELCTLCGVEILIVVFSPAGKVFSFGHPNVDALIDRFLSNSSVPGAQEMQMSASLLNNLNNELTALVDNLEIEKKKGEEMDRRREARREHCWWEAPINELGLDELEQLCASMEDLKTKVTNQSNILLMEGQSNINRVGNAIGFVVPEQYERKPVGLVGSSSTYVPPPHVFHSSVSVPPPHPGFHSSVSAQHPHLGFQSSASVPSSYPGFQSSMSVPPSHPGFQSSGSVPPSHPEFQSSGSAPPPHGFHSSSYDRL